GCRAGFFGRCNDPTKGMAAVLTTSSMLRRETNWAAMRRAASRFATMPAQNAESSASLSDGEDESPAPAVATSAELLMRIAWRVKVWSAYTKPRTIGTPDVEKSLVHLEAASQWRSRKERS